MKNFIDTKTMPLSFVLVQGTMIFPETKEFFENTVTPWAKEVEKNYRERNPDESRS